MHMASTHMLGHMRAWVYEVRFILDIKPYAHVEYSRTTQVWAVVFNQQVTHLNFNSLIASLFWAQRYLHRCFHAIYPFPTPNLTCNVKGSEHNPIFNFIKIISMVEQLLVGPSMICISISYLFLWCNVEIGRDCKDYTRIVNLFGVPLYAITMLNYVNATRLLDALTWFFIILYCLQPCKHTKTCMQSSHYHQTPCNII